MKDMLFSIKMFSVFAFIFALTELNANNIKIEGIVQDIENNKTLSNVNIFDKDNNMIGSTDSNGNFEITIDSSYHFVLKFVKFSYENYSILLDSTNNKFLSIKLRPKVVHLPEIVVDAEIHNKFDEIQTSAYTITESKIQEKLGNTLAITLKNQVGLAMASLGPAPARPVFRGFNGNKISFLANGIPVSDMSATSPDHSLTIDPMLINRVELIRGPKVLMHSSNSFSASVDTENETDKIPKQFSADAGLFAESVNSGYSAYTRAKYPYKNLGIIGGISYHKSNNMQTPIGILKNTENEIINYNVTGLFTFDMWMNRINYENYNNYYGVPGGFIGGHPNGVDIEIHRNSISATSIIHFHEAYLDNIVINAYRNYYRHIERESNQSIGSEFVYREYSLNSTFNHSNEDIHNNGAIGLGFINKDFLVGGYVFTPETILKHFNLFWFEELKVADYLIQASMRGEYARFEPQPKQAMNNQAKARQFSTYAFSVSVLKDIFSNTSIGLNLSKSSRIPSIEELYSDGPHLAAYSYEIGNTDLNSENGYGVELFSLIKQDDFTFYFTSYFNYYDYYIIPRNTGKINYQQILPIYATSGVEASVYGFEVQVDTPLFDNFFVNTNLSYTIGEILETNSPLPLIPPLKLNFELKYRIENWVTGLMLEFAASQNRIDIFEEATNSYILTNLFLQKTFLINNTTLSATFSIDNLFDIEYYNHLSRIKSIYPESSRNVKLLLKYNL